MLEVIPSPISKAAADQLLHVVDDDVGFLTSTDDDYCESFMVDDGDDNLFDYIDFTSCDVVPSFFDADGDILPDLEVDPTELLAEFEDHCHEEDKKGTRTQGEASSSQQGGHKEDENKRFLEGGGQKKISGDEVLSAENTSKSSSEAQIISKKKKKPSKNSNGKRKVDWTPELHRRFVQAVEQLGIDKAVPSRILEIMGIECLTRHNIASHLQKYRSHRKHLMAREAEAASWAQKRQMYAAAAAPRTTTTKDIMPAPWVVPTVGFPPPPFGRPLHVWGHPPTAAPPLLPVWPRHLAPPPRPWAPVDPAAAPYWQQQQQQCNGAMKWGPHAVPPTMMPSSTTAAMLPRFPVPGMMPHPMYRPPLIMPPSPSQTAAGRKLATLQLQLDAHPSKESIDAAIGDVLVKPWLPLPLGLKPPSLDSVMSELHRQGIPKIPPAATTTGS